MDAKLRESLPSRLRVGSGVGLLSAPSLNTPTPSPSRKREGDEGELTPLPKRTIFALCLTK